MNKFDKALENAHGIEFAGFKFEDPDYEALIVDEDNYLEHLRVQAAGIAYYSTLTKTAEREYNELEKNYRRRYNEMYSECADVLSRIGKKNGVKDIESLIQCKYEDELNNWNIKLNEAKERLDGISAYYEAWKAKGFALNSMTSLITAGLLTPKVSIYEEDVNESTKRRMNLQNAHSILSKK